MGAASPADLPAAARLLAAGRPAAAARFRDLFAAGGLDPAGLFVSRSGGVVRGAVLAQVLPGALGLLFPPRGDAPADLLNAALGWLRGRGVKVCQAFAPGGDRSDEPTLAGGGFRHVTAVVNLRKELGEPDAAGPLAFAPVGPAEEAAFAAALLATHDGSHDCPELTGPRTAADLVDGFRPGPCGRRFLATHEGEPVGVVLLDDGGEPGAAELSYLGLVPAARGRGWGAPLVRFAAARAAAGGARVLDLSVDARNAPARRLYARHGFRETDRREVFLWVEPAATSPELRAAE